VSILSRDTDYREETDMDDNAFFDRAIVASAATREDEDAVRQLRGLFSAAELTAWEASKAAMPYVPVPVGHDDERDLYWATWGGYGIEGTSPSSYEEAIHDLASHVRDWAGRLSGGGDASGETAALSGLVAELSTLSKDGLYTYLLVRASFDRGSLTFRIAEFVAEDGSASQRAIPFSEGEPPAEVDLRIDGRVQTFQGSFRGDRVVYSPVGGVATPGDTLRQVEPTADVDAEFQQPDFRPPPRRD
jgi:hypothetical protein